MHVEETVRIAAPAERIWQAWTDVESWSGWTPSVTWVRRLDAGEFGVGSRAAVKQPAMRPMIWQVTAATPDVSFVWSARTAGTVLVGGHYLSPGDDGTTVARLTIDHTGALAGALDLLVGSRIRRYLHQETDGIRRHCEPV